MPFSYEENHLEQNWTMLSGRIHWPLACITHSNHKYVTETHF